jgi:hypothetical protein
MEDGNKVKCDLCHTEIRCDDQLVQSDGKDYHTKNAEGRRCWLEVRFGTKGITREDTRW